MDVADEAMRRDVIKSWEADPTESYREYYELETDRHACADAEEEETTLKLGKISPREAVVLIKSISVEGGKFGSDYYAEYLMQVREILARLDMK